MARLYVDRNSIFKEATEKLPYLIADKIQKKKLINNKNILHRLILKAGFDEDYKNFGSDLSNIRLSIKLATTIINTMDGGIAYETHLLQLFGELTRNAY